MRQRHDSPGGRAHAWPRRVAPDGLGPADAGGPASHGRIGWDARPMAWAMARGAVTPGAMRERPTSQPMRPRQAGPAQTRRVTFFYPFHKQSRGMSVEPHRRPVRQGKTS